MYRDVVSAFLIEDNFKVVSDQAAVRVKNDKKIARFRFPLQIFGTYLRVQRYGFSGWIFKTVNPRGPVKPECDRVSAIHGKKPGPFYCFRKFLKKIAIFNLFPVGADPGDNHGDSRVR